MNTVYIEQAIRHHPRALAILEKLKPKTIIVCEQYQHVFNPKSQDFRLQKQQPALILAEKKGRRVLATPEGFGIGGQQNYYFSHMLNCLYDCRYCFLQGMYASANYVLFVNYEDFMTDIDALLAQQDEPVYFFSGYDADSLAYESTSGFLEAFIPYFADKPNAILELRSKSPNVRALLKLPVINNCVAAFSFTPQAISSQVEHKVPSVEKRIAAMQALAERGWTLGLRLDPLIYADNFSELYQELIDAIFTAINPQKFHSVSVGPMRFPEKMYHKIVKLYPEDKLLAHPLEKRDNHYSYSAALEQTMKKTVYDMITPVLDKALLFECSPL